LLHLRFSQQALMHSAVDRAAVALTMWAAATSQRTVLLPREALRPAARRIVDPKIAHPKAARKITVAPSAIGPTILTRLTFTTMTIGSVTIPVAATRTITWIIPGNTAASTAALAAAMSII
jgi:hypothetical protein